MNEELQEGKMRRMLLLLLIIISCFFSSSYSLNSSSVSSTLSRSSCRPDQKAALLAFKHELQRRCDSHAPLDKTKAWNEDGDCCSWDGVTCDSKSGLVIELDLNSSCLYGHFSSNSSLFRLHRLQRLDLSSNNFNSSLIPSEFSRLTGLTHLNLTDSQFSGRVPLELFHLTKLVSLRLGSVFSKGLFFEKLDWDAFTRNLTSLQEVVFENIIIPSHLSDSIGDLSSLTRFRLYGCNLQGPVPSSLGKLSKLTHLGLSSNKLNGVFPSALLNLTELKYLDLSNNDLTGELPSDMSRFSKLSYFDASFNFITGTIPSSLFMITLLKTVDLRVNQLRGPLNLENASSFELIDMSLGHNYLDGPVPRSISKFVNLEMVDLSLPNTSDTTDLFIFTELKSLTYLSLAGHTLSFENVSSNVSLPRLFYLNLSFCRISVFPNFLRNLLDLSILDLFTNNIGGQVPRWLWRLPKIAIVDISNNSFNGFEGPSPFQASSITDVFASSNNFTGRIPRSICKAGFLVTLDLFNNNFSGSIPRCLGSSTRSLKVLSLQRNSLTGSLPQMCKDNNNLTTIEVGHNRLEGKLPRSLMKCDSLRFLNVESNQIKDKFPIWMMNLPDLQVLVLRSNLFHGKVWHPQVSLGFPELRVIDASHNMLTGVLPSTYFSNWRAMSSVELQSGSDFEYMMSNSELGFYEDSIVLNSKGSEMKFEKIRTDLISIDYSHNRFEGPIPESIGMLKALRTLNLSGNAFTGRIPPSLINLTSLESLDLSRNQLSGIIPPDLVKSSSLSTVNLSHNKLQGPIPQSPQFQTQSIWSFMGNEGLCGLPLPKECGNVRPEVQAKEPAEEEEEMFSWIAAAIGFVPAFVAAAVITHITTINHKGRSSVRTTSGRNKNRRSKVLHFP